MAKYFRIMRFDWPLHFILVLTNWLPDNVLFLRMRGILARPFLGNCGSNLRLGRNISFYNPSKIRLGNNVYIALGCWFMAGDTITIGDEVQFGPYCVVVSSTHTRCNRSYRYGHPRHAPIEIGRGSWVAAHCTVTAGSIIGPGSLVGAGSVVINSVPPDVIAAGAPASIVKVLGDE